MSGRGGIVCAGNWIVDIVHTLDRWPAKSDLVNILSEAEGIGGGAANVAVDLAAFDAGLSIYAAGLIGGDRHAETIRAACRAAGIDDRHIAASDGVTAHTHVMNLPGDSRTFLYHAGTNDRLGPDDIAVEALAADGARLFYLGYLNLLAGLDAIGADERTGAAVLLARARAAGFVTCMDLVSTDGPDFRRTVEATVGEVDYLFLNEVEAARATGLPIRSQEDAATLEQAGRQLIGAGVRRAVILHTATLALWVPTAGATSHTVPPAVAARDVVSPVGAGDAFCAGVLYGIHAGWTPETAMTLGHRAAAASLRSPTATGSIPPLRDLMPGCDLPGTSR